ncbi:MAG: transcriptional regulator [Lachnospiraceae bacterium]|nr:transcriptional regulator [Lachnospiraceae bacterium]
MGRKNDITGRRFGSLVAVEPTEERKNGYTVWTCKCDCGNTVRIPSRYLKNGWAISCGCVQKPPRYDDLTGRRFGKLTVLRKTKEQNARKDYLWECVCDCGGKILAPSGQLRSGYRKSCGCLSHPPLKDWVGKQFGRLIVTAYDGKRDGKHYWKCRCVCGNEVSVCQSSLKIGHTMSCGCLNTPYNSKHFVDGTCIEAIRSKTIARNNTSGVRGVYKNNRIGKWCAQITFKGKTRYLGSYDTLREATIARQKGEELFEEFLQQYDEQTMRDKTQKAESDRTRIRAYKNSDPYTEETAAEIMKMVRRKTNEAIQVM